MNIKSRKVLGWLIGIIILLTVSVLVVLFAPTQFDGWWFVAGLCSITFAFIGGAVWSDWIKSKHFKPELMDK